LLYINIDEIIEMPKGQRSSSVRVGSLVKVCSADKGAFLLLYRNIDEIIDIPKGQ